MVNDCQNCTHARAARRARGPAEFAGNYFCTTGIYMEVVDLVSPDEDSDATEEEEEEAVIQAVASIEAL